MVTTVTVLSALWCDDGRGEAQVVLVQKLLVTVQSEHADTRPQETPGLFSRVVAGGRSKT